MSNTSARNWDRTWAEYFVNSNRVINNRIPVQESPLPQQSKQVMPIDKAEGVEVKANPNGLFASVSSKSLGGLGLIIYNPTSNCQIQSYCGFYPVLDCSSDLEVIIAILAKIWNGSQRKTSLLIDIPADRMPKLKKLFNEDEIQIEAPYKNNTGSNMAIFLLQIKKMLIRHKAISA